MTREPKLKYIKTDRYWGSFAMGYLELAKQGFESLRIKPNIGRTKLFKENKPTFSLKEGHLIIASIWNIKQGLELCIKSLGVNFNKRYWDQHDLIFLFEELEKQIQEWTLPRDLKAMKILVKKYSSGNFSPKTIFNDKENNYFRYPEINNAHLDYSFVHDLKRKDINLFLKDIHNIMRSYHLLEAEIRYFRSYWELHKKVPDKQFMLNTKNPGYK